jgi:UDP-2,4-diacetamido-2,4,6-trideoxy-beta-L-altropyranose hydrolase
MFIVFRADANAIIGTGHVMRCLALASALTRRGAHCLFICRNHDLGTLADRIRNEGHGLCLLSTPGSGMSAGEANVHTLRNTDEQIADATASAELLARHPRIDWLVVDHYALAATWQSMQRTMANNILVIDDLANRPHECDLLLDQNLRSEHETNPYARLTPEKCQHLLGPRYALLRPEFAVTREKNSHNPTAYPPRLLIMFGGADHANLTGRVVRLMKTLGLEAPIDVVIGPLHAHKEQIAHQVSGLPGATLHVAPDNIAELMSRAALAVASPGSSSWERCSQGLPSITLAVADNQMAMAETLAWRGAHLFLGRADAVADNDLAAAIRLLYNNIPMRQSMAHAATELTDGRGAERVAARLFSSGISVRPAINEDARMLYAWRNDTRTRLQSFDTAPIAWEHHQSWFAKALINPAQMILIGTKDETDIGCVRFDLTDKVAARVSIYLDPCRKGEGLASPLLGAADAWLRRAHPEIHQQVAEIKADNEASRQAFFNAGYHLDHSVFIK